MDDTKQLRVRLKAETVVFLEEYQESERLPGIGPVIDRLIREYQTLSNKQWDLNYISQSVSREVEQQMTAFWKEKFVEDLTPIRRSTQQTDIQTQVLIELVQALMQTENIVDIMPTTDYRPSFLETAETAVKTRIEQRKQHKHSNA